MKIDEAGTYTIEYTATDGCGNSTTEDRLVTVTPPPVYGAIWDGSENPAWTRTDLAANFPDPSPAVANGTGSSPFDDIMPWSGMQIVEDAEAGTLVSIPKFYYKWTRDGASMKLQIANEPQEGFFVSPAHADRGDGFGERDIVYVGRYHCSSGYKSRTGVMPLVRLSRATNRQGIHAIGASIWQYDFAMYWTIRMLYLVEFANWDSQRMIGIGCGNGSSIENEGATDSMQYHTGTNASSRDNGGSVQYRHIEGLWSNVEEFVDGIYFSNTNVYCIKNPSDFNDTSGGTFVGICSSSRTGGTISAYSEPSISGFEYALIPTDIVTVSDYKYITDLYLFNQYSKYPVIGGRANNVTNGQGLFYITFNASSSTDGDNNFGSRLMKLPND